MNISYPHYKRIYAKAMEIADRLGSKAGAEAVEDEGCEDVGLMGEYERNHLGLGDFEDEFVHRLELLADRAAFTHQERHLFMDDAWSAWVDGRNQRVRQSCPNAQEYGSD